MQMQAPFFILTLHSFGEGQQLMANARVSVPYWYRLQRLKLALQDFASRSSELK